MRKTRTNKILHYRIRCILHCLNSIFYSTRNYTISQLIKVGECSRINHNQKQKHLHITSTSIQFRIQFSAFLNTSSQVNTLALISHQTPKLQEKRRTEILRNCLRSCRHFICAASPADYSRINKNEMKCSIKLLSCA